MTYAIMGRATNMTPKESISVRNVEHIHTSTIKLDLSHADLAVESCSLKEKALYVNEVDINNVHYGAAAISYFRCSPIALFITDAVAFF